MTSICLGIVAIFATVIPLAIWIEKQPELQEERGLLGIGMALTMVIMAGSVLYRHDQRVKSLGLACPECSRLLIGAMAMALRICPHCHKPFLNADSESSGESEDAQAAMGSVTLADLDVQQAAESKRFRRVVRDYLVASLICAGLSAAVIWYAGFWSYSFFPEATFYPMRILPMMIGSVVVGVGTIIAGRISRQHRRLQCQECRAILSRNSILRMTGNCTSCGCRVVRDPLMPDLPETEPAETLLSREEFRKRSAQIQRRGPLCCLAGGAAGFLWVAAVFWNAVAAGRSHLRDEMDPITAGLAFLGIVIQIGVVAWMENRLNRQLVCRACDQPLTSPHIVQATGCCTHCGRQVLCAPVDARKFSSEA